jgi:PAS domain S-box-containing protein
MNRYQPRTGPYRLGLGFAYAITLLVIVAAGAIAWLNSRSQDETARLVIRNHQLLASLNQIETTMTDAETGQRGYLLTGSDEFLEPYKAATGTGAAAVIHRPPIARLLASMRATPQASSTELRLLDRIDTLVRDKLAELQQTVDLRRAGKLAEAVAIVREGRGKRTMDALRATLSSMRAEERRQLEDSDRRRAHAVSRAQLLGWVTCALSLLTIAFLVATVRRSHAALVSKHEDFHLLADNMSQHAWTATAAGEWCWFNRRWQSYTGLDADLDRDEQWRQATDHPSHRDRAESGFRHAVATGEPWEDIFPLRAGDGSYEWFLVRAMPVRGADGKVLRWFGTNTNIDERLRLEQELKDGNRRKDEFIATLAHELRNPLAPIQAGVELMRMNPAFPPQLERTREIMHRQLSHLVRLIDDLLDVSRLTSGKLELKMEPVPLRSVIESALETSRPQVESSGHELEVRMPAQALMVRGDLVRLAQVVSNLLNNGAKYTPSGGRVRIAAERDGQEAVISVSDNGIGIDSATLPDIFDLFSQSPSAGQRRLGGIGIGLSIARQLVRMHGGSLMAESQGLGRGSTFTIRLPLVALEDRDEPSAHHARPEPAAGATGHKRVLILDDNVDAAQTLGSLLEMAGHTVALAHTGREAIELAPGFAPDIAFLDIGLPDMSGHDVARALRRESTLQATRLVALTGWGAAQDRQESREAGFDFHLTKPVFMETLSEVLPDLALPTRQGQS